ncbi:MAG: FAD-linked oxidase C-terminal domain-containing protein [Vulcanimicrobiaceae bacterium]
MSTATTAASPVHARFAAIVGTRNTITAASELRTYECDGLTGIRVAPEVVVLPETTQQVAACVTLARELGMPIVARGAGTGLSGGAVPSAGSIVIGLARMKKILEVDLPNERICVQSGVINLDVSKLLAPLGYYYAPDPSSQSVWSIGGNVAENSGGAHCLKYGFTVNHAVGATVVLATGDIVTVGGPVPDALGYDLMSVVVGSEGMLAIVTEVWLRILRLPEKTRTIFATFPTTAEGGAAVSSIIAAGIIPAAVEMMDQLAMEAIVAATGVDWPLDVGASLLVDVDGSAAEVDHTAEAAIAMIRAAGALDVRSPRDATERALMWKGRKSAFAAVGRISPNYIVQDGVVPRKEISAVLREIADVAAASGLRVANVFHAGDGNLHPLVLFDAGIAGQETLAEHVGGEILRICMNHGGSITGEHGVGLDKQSYMGELFTDDDLDTMNFVRCAFDPERVLNPGKVFPTPRLCGDRPGKFVLSAHEASGEAGRG